MLERLINWRAKVNGINWFEGTSRGAPPVEMGGRPLTREEESYLVGVERSLTDLPPSPLRSPATKVAQTVFAAAGFTSGVFAVATLADGEWGPAAGFLAMTGLCVYLLLPAYTERHGQ